MSQYQSKFFNQAAPNIAPCELICLQCKTIYNTDILQGFSLSSSEHKNKNIESALLYCIKDKVCYACTDKHPLHERPPHNVTHNYTHTYIDPNHVKQLLEPMVQKFLVDARSAIMQDITDFYSARDEELSNTPYSPQGKTLIDTNNNGDSIPQPRNTGTLFH